MGMLALTVDVGGIMFERRQLQNGADAASMSLAKTCAKSASAPECASGAAASAAVSTIAGQNSADGAQAVPVADGTTPLVCGHNAGTLPECTLAADASDLSRCVPKSAGLDPGTSLRRGAHPHPDVVGGNHPSQHVLTGHHGEHGRSDRHRVCEGSVGTGSAFQPPGARSDDVGVRLGDAGRIHGTKHGGLPPGPGPAAPSTVRVRLTSPTPWPTVANPAVEMRCGPRAIQPRTATHRARAARLRADSHGSPATGDCSAVILDGSWVHVGHGSRRLSYSYLNPYVGTVVYVPVFDCRARPQN